MPNGNQWDLVYSSEGTHETTVITHSSDEPFADLLSNTGDGDLLTLTFRSLPGLTGWHLMGGPDLVNGFPTDHTPQTTITEPTPGTYTATIDISDLGDTHFFQIGMTAVAAP